MTHRPSSSLSKGSGDVDLERAWAHAVQRFPYLDAIPPFKTEWLYDVYNTTLRQAGQIDVLLELGIYKGGSVVLWREALGCQVIGIDLDPRPDTMALVDRYLRESSAEGSITCLWRTNQTDAAAIKKAVNQRGGRIDVVIDDASHLYRPTRRSFEILFPLVRPAGRYYVEDWGAGERPDFQSPDGPVSKILDDAISWVQTLSSGVSEVHVTPAVAWMVKAS